MYEVFLRLASRFALSGSGGRSFVSRGGRQLAGSTRPAGHNYTPTNTRAGVLARGTDDVAYWRKIGDRFSRWVRGRAAALIAGRTLVCWRGSSMQPNATLGRATRRRAGCAALPPLSGGCFILVLTALAAERCCVCLPGPCCDASWLRPARFPARLPLSASFARFPYACLCLAYPFLCIYFWLRTTYVQDA